MTSAFGTTLCSSFKAIKSRKAIALFRCHRRALGFFLSCGSKIPTRCGKRLCQSIMAPLSRQQDRPRTDYERWLYDQDNRYSPRNNPQYHPPTSDNGLGAHDIQEPLSTEAPLSSMSGNIPQSKERLHGYFLTSPGMQSSSPGVPFAHTPQPPLSVKRGAVSAYQLSLMAVAIIVLIRAAKTVVMRARNRKALAVTGDVCIGKQ
ncbi:hypothetical protein BDV59DRAFT_174195 [Aspergillus ambiguus]|uniref:uncharacterized protein n=1 Tax=Aspergillus ambiguus TaxID=176160 RepID=UPI003CCE1022